MAMLGCRDTQEWEWAFFLSHLVRIVGGEAFCARRDLPPCVGAAGKHSRGPIEPTGLTEANLGHLISDLSELLASQEG